MRTFDLKHLMDFRAERLVLLVVVAFYMAIVQFAFEQVAVPMYDPFMGMEHVGKSAWADFLLYLLTFLPALWLPTRLARPSQLLVWSLYLCVYVPSDLVALTSLLSEEQALGMAFSMLAGMLILQTAYLVPTIRFPRLLKSRKAFWTLILVGSAVAYLATLVAFRGEIRLVGFREIYEQREVYTERLTFPLNYLMAWQSQVVNPLFIGIGLVTGNLLMFLGGVVGQVFFFMVAAFKAMPASVVLILAVWFMVRRKNAQAGMIMTLASGLFILGSILPKLGQADKIITGTFWDFFIHGGIWRVYLGNGYLTNLYYDYFAYHPTVNFAQVTGLKLFLSDPYGTSYTEALGTYYFGDLNYPNANLWADGFANLGYPGVLIESAMCAVTLWLIDCACRRVESVPALLVLAYQTITITNVPIYTAVLGSGLLFSILILNEIPPEDQTPRRGRGLFTLRRLKPPRKTAA